MPVSAPPNEFLIKRQLIITETKVDGKFTVSIGCVVRDRNIGTRGIVFRLADPIEHSTIAITVCWFSGETAYFSLEEFAEQCEITHTKF